MVKIIFSPFLVVENIQTNVSTKFQYSVFARATKQTPLTNTGDCSAFVRRDALVLAIVLMSIGFIGCKKQIGFDKNEMNTQTRENIPTNDIKIVNNAVFVYPIQKFSNLKSMLKNLDNSNIKTERDFYSLYDYYTDAEKIFDSLGVEGLKEKGFNLNYFDYDTSGIFELKLSDEALAKRLSPEGFIQFSDTIMKVNTDNLIFIKNGDYNLVTEVKKKDFCKNNITNSNIEIVKEGKSYPVTVTDSYDNG